MPITKASLGSQGEHLLADDNGNLPDEGETLADLSFAVAPHAPGTNRHSSDHGGSVVLYESEAHYLACVSVARTRAANLAALAAEGGS